MKSRRESGVRFKLRYYRVYFRYVLNATGTISLLRTILLLILRYTIKVYGSVSQSLCREMDERNTLTIAIELI